ncbi:MAG: cold-shock protein, partial [Acidimicrobiales bacterium]
RGRVRWFNPEVGIGVIEPDEPGWPEIFVHYADVDAPLPLRPAQPVEYRVFDPGTALAGRVRPLAG